MRRFLMPMTAPFISKIARLMMLAVLSLHYLLFGKSLFASR
jgi:hypothetical protein